MGDLQSWPPLSAANGGGGGVEYYQQLPSQPLLQSPGPNPPPEEIKAESWLRVEEAAKEVLRCILPTDVSEQRRKAVVDYLQCLLRTQIGCEVCPFGSVPLKTYLPDGDIDLTALGYPNTEDSLASDVHSVLEAEEKNKEAEFEVKDVQFIYAEVKLIKCIIQNIVVDISFNQIGGLCTLGFLEQVDRKIGKGHLFKRSIVLIKAWCYYESRILGAHHGLISTYALETLVLYIFHLFHDSLDGPLAVLYRFLDYYSKFDWDNYCISLHGPVSVSSLPELIVEKPEANGNNLLFSIEFIRECLDMYSVPPRGIETGFRAFSQKHLNIVDPLKQNNNLGRSVSKGNFYRIRSAFSYGARKLGLVLQLPTKSIAEEVRMFFANTLDRHGNGERPDVQSLPSTSDYRLSDGNRVKTASPQLRVENSFAEKLTEGLPNRDFSGTLSEDMKNIQISDLDKKDQDKQTMYKDLGKEQLDSNKLNKNTNMKSSCLVEGDAVSNSRLSGDARDLASMRISNPQNASIAKIHYAPQFLYHSQNGSLSLDRKQGDEAKSSVASDRYRSSDDDRTYESEHTGSTFWNKKNAGSASTSSMNSHISEDSSVADQSNTEKLDGRSPNSSSLADLTGDIQMHHTNLFYALDLQEFTPSSYFVPFQPPSPSYHRSKDSWNAFQPRNMYTHIGQNGPVPGTAFPPNGYYMINPSLLSGAYITKDIPRTRGTGTYFPNTNFRSYKERQNSGRGKTQISSNHQQRFRNGHTEALQDRISLEDGSEELGLQQQAPVYNGNGRGKPAWDASHSSSGSPRALSRSAFKGAPQGNNFGHPLEGKLEFGSLGPISTEVPLPERGSYAELISPVSQGSGSVSPATTKRPSSSFNHERSTQQYQLKDEGDFPPLNS